MAEKLIVAFIVALWILIGISIAHSVSELADNFRQENEMIIKSVENQK